MVNRSKQKGTSFESLVRDYLIEVWDDRIVRPALHGSNDKGDIANFRINNDKLAIECKNRKAMDLSGWVNEAEVEANNLGAIAGIAIHKRARKGQAQDQYVTMTLGSFIAILSSALNTPEEQLILLINVIS